MMPRVAQPPSDNDSLQADVMRFMAIIAFCLIAILALVKEVTPVRTPVPVEQAASAESAPEPTIEASRRQPEPVAVTERWQTPLPKPSPDVGQTEATRKPAAQQKPLDIEAVSLPQKNAAKTADATETPKESDEGLSLRFASDNDFMRLIARGDIRVYAFNDASVLGLNEAYEFLATRTPGKVYELLPQTIPTLIVDALSRAPQHGDIGYNWGITLPSRIETQISDYLTTARSGQLVIDRYGEVHHVAQD